MSVVCYRCVHCAVITTPRYNDSCLGSSLGRDSFDGTITIATRVPEALPIPYIPSTFLDGCSIKPGVSTLDGNTYIYIYIYIYDE